MDRQKAIKRLAQLRELVEHPATGEDERDTALRRIQELKKLHKLGSYELGEDCSFIRRRKPRELRRDRTVKFRLTVGESKRLDELASRHNMSVSEYIRSRIFGPTNTELMEG